MISASTEAYLILAGFRKREPASVILYLLKQQSGDEELHLERFRNKKNAPPVYHQSSRRHVHRLMLKMSSSFLMAFTIVISNLWKAA